MKMLVVLCGFVLTCGSWFVNAGCCGCGCGVRAEERSEKPPPPPEGLEPGAPPKAKADPDQPATHPPAQSPGD